MTANGTSAKNVVNIMIKTKNMNLETHTFKTLVIKLGAKLLTLVAKGAKFWLAAASAVTYS